MVARAARQVVAARAVMSLMKDISRGPAQVEMAAAVAAAVAAAPDGADAAEMAPLAAVRVTLKLVKLVKAQELAAVAAVVGIIYHPVPLAALRAARDIVGMCELHIKDNHEQSIFFYTC